MADLVELRCDAPAALCLSRIESRLLAGDDASEADADAYRSIEERFASWPAATVVATTGTVDDAVDEAIGAAGWLRPIA